MTRAHLMFQEQGNGIRAFTKGSNSDFVSRHERKEKFLHTCIHSSLACYVIGKGRSVELFGHSSALSKVQHFNREIRLISREGQKQMWIIMKYT